MTHVDGMIAVHQPIKVLDHGYVKLVDSMGTDETVIEAARMSTGKGFISWDSYSVCDECSSFSTIPALPVVHDTTCVRGVATQKPRGDAGFLEFLYKSGHSSPFEQVEASMEMQAPLFVFRELQRHRTGMFNEFSGRYAQMPDLHYLPPLERFQAQSKVNKQGSAGAFDPVTAQRMQFYLKTEQKQVYDHYDELVEEGLAKEIARINTPLSRYSKMRLKFNGGNWFKLFNLRLRPNVMQETRECVQACASIVKQLWPRSYALFEEYDLNGVRLSASEVKTVQRMIAECEVSIPGVEELAKKFRGGP